MWWAGGGWQDIDPDLRWFCTWGVLIIAIGFFLQWCGFFGPEPPPDWSMPAEQIQPIEEWRVD